MYALLNHKVHNIINEHIYVNAIHTFSQNCRWRKITARLRISAGLQLLENGLHAAAACANVSGWSACRTPTRRLKFPFLEINSMIFRQCFGIIAESSLLLTITIFQLPTTEINRGP